MPTTATRTITTTAPAADRPSRIGVVMTIAPEAGAGCVASANIAPYSLVICSPAARGNVNDVRVVGCARGLLKLTVYCCGGRLRKQYGSVASVNWLALMTLLLIITL